MKRLAAFVPNVLGHAPGQRIRIETWAGHLREAGWAVDFYPFEDARLHAVLYRPGQLLTKAQSILSCYRRQLSQVLRRPACDLVLIYREAALIGPAILERLTRSWRVPILYDIDDPIFVPYRSPSNGLFSYLKCLGKTKALLRLSDRVLAINSLIGRYAGRFNPAVTVVPNCVDVDAYGAALNQADRPPRLVWTGSYSSMPNLRSIHPVLRQVQAKHRVPVRVIGVGGIELDGVDLEMIQWSPQSEISAFRDSGIGLVPLLEHPWNQWKFFLKTIQYMAAGLAVVAQRIGSNAEVIQDGVNGFLVDTPEEWSERLSQLVEDAALRRRVGEAARATAVERYSTQRQRRDIPLIFQEALDTARTHSLVSEPEALATDTPVRR